MRLLLPFFSVPPFLTSNTKVQTLKCVLVFMKLGLSSLAVLNISVASVLILLIFIDSLPVMSRRVLQSLL